MALLRVCIGGLLIADLIDRGKDIAAFYTDSGLLPRSLMLSNFPGSWSVSFHNLTGQYEGQLLLFLISGIFATMLIVGYRTTLASIISWILLVSLDSRNYLIVFGADQVFRLILFWGIFLPWHARFSIDSAVCKKNTLPTKYISAATIAYILQIIIIYFFSVLHKSGPAWRIDGTAVYYSLALHSFRTPFFGETLFQLPFLLKPLTYGVFWLEALGSLFLFIPYRKDFFRYMVVVSFILLHVGLGLALRLGIFPWVCVIAWLALLPTGFWDRVLKLLDHPKRKRVIIFYDNSCGFCYKAVSILKNFFLLPRSSIMAAVSNPKTLQEMNDHNSWIIVDNNKTRYYKYEGFLALASASPLLSIFVPVLSISIFKRFGSFLYNVISGHRKEICPLNGHEQVFNPKFSYNSRLINALAACSIIYIIIWNINTLPQFKNTMPAIIRPVGIILGINQKWALFAPEPSTKSGWFVIAARLKDGTFYDIYNNRSNISFEKPTSVISTYKSARWQRFLVNITAERNKKYASQYINYLCQSWNKTHSTNKQAEEISIGYIFEITKPDYRYESGKNIIGRESCSSADLQVEQG